MCVCVCVCVCVYVQTECPTLPYFSSVRVPAELREAQSAADLSLFTDNGCPTVCESCVCVCACARACV